MTIDPPATLLLPPDQMELLQRLNATDAPIPAGTLDGLVLERALARPDDTAVVAQTRTLSYGELAARAHDLAARLGGIGVRPGETVAVVVEPGWEWIVALLGGLAAGARCACLDPALPQVPRWKRLLDLGARAVLTQSWLAERLTWSAGAELLEVDRGGLREEPAGAAHEPGQAAVVVHPGEAAPVLSMRHDALVNTFSDVNRRAAVAPGDRLLALSPPGSDLALYDALGVLMAGATVVVPDDVDLRNPPAWVALMEQRQVTLWNTPPALAGMLLVHLEQRGAPLPESLRLVLLSRDPLLPSLARRLRAAAAGPLTIVNLGGSAATGIWSTWQEVGEPEAAAKRIPIGRPLANQRVFVLDEAMAPCPVWVTGQLWYGGRGLADGGDDFAAHPGSGERLYRSPETGRVLGDGAIELVGDDATQCELSGHALSLRDVEVALAQHPAVRAVAVVAFGAPEPEGLVAYAELAAGQRAEGAELRDFLRRRMSPYLLPERVEVVGRLPLTATGTIDRAALTALAQPVAAPGGAPAPQAPAGSGDGELTERVARLAAQALGVAAVEPDMNLLDLGASSVDLVRLATLVEQELGLQVDVEELIRFPSVSVMVSRFGATATAPPAAAAGGGAQGGGAQGGLILDPVERAAFKDRQPALRRELERMPTVALAAVDADGRLAARRSHRDFDPAPVPLPALGRLLDALRQHRLHGRPKYRYPSAGSLYPVQTYLYAKPDRVEGLAGGTYYHDPVRHRLLLLNEGVEVGPEAHAWINRDAFRASAFSLHLVAELDAIEPMYGKRAWDYCVFEAGAMGELLMLVAAEQGLGLCPVGDMDFAPLRDRFLLGGRQTLLHTLLGGVPSAAAELAPSELEIARMLERIDGLGDQVLWPDDAEGPA